MKKGSMLTALLLAMVMCFSGFAVAEDVPVVDDLVYTPDEQANTGTEVATLATYEQQQAVALYNALVSATTLQGFYDQLLLANEVDEAVRSLFTIDWTNALYTRVDELYALEDPEDEDALWLYEDAMAGIAWVFGVDDARTFVNISGTIAAQNISSNTSWSLTGNVTVTGRVVVKSGAKLTISTPTSVARTIQRGSSYKGVMFYIESGATLEINGYGMQSDENSNKNWTNNCVIIDGKSIASAAPAIECLGKLILRDMVIRNNFSASSGGGILFGNSSKDKPVSVNGELTRTLIENCKGTAGSAVMIRSYTKGTVTMTDSVFQNCSTYESDTGGTIRTNGGVDTSLTITRCKIQNNTSHEHGGGIYWNANGSNALLKIQNSEITGNKALGSNGKGGGLFLEGTKMDLSSTVISGNTAKFGAGININSYSGGAGVNMGSNNSFNLNLGKDVVVKDNTASAGGGGVALTLYGSDPADGYTYNINISENALIENNTATTSGGGIYVEVAKGNVNLNEYNLKVNITGGTITKNVATNGNGGALCIDRKYNQKNRTLLVSMSAGTVSDNKAANGNGGSVYLSDGSMKVTGGTLDGFVDTASAKNGGGVYINKGNFEMTGGNIQNNRASVNGGAIYVSSGSFTISGGEITSNVASQNGGAAYVTGGNFTMSGGVMASNTATVNGGAVYLTGGNFLMKNGTIGGSEAANGNSAQNGGAVYVNGGNFTMENGVVNNNSATAGGGAIYLHGGNFHMDYGQINNNKANNGGAVYLAGTSTTTFEMLSGFMNKNEAVQLTSGSGDLGGDGGAIYATSGTLKIGVNGCKGKDDVSKHVSGRSHPVIQENEADDCGGGISISNEGVVHFYCGVANENIAKFKGVGMNVFMVGGTFNLYDGAELGSYHEPELVVIGGTLNDMTVDKILIRLQYYQTQDSDEIYLHGFAEKDEWVDLPDGEYFMTKPSSDVTFFGWTAKAGEDLNVRKKADYLPSGTAISITDIEVETEALNQNTFDGKEDEKMNLYALWAPSKSKITYVDGLTYEIIAEHQPDEYELHSERVYNTYIPAVVKPGYAVVGWYIYQDEGKDANWGFEPYYTGDGTVRDYAHLDFAKLEELDQYLELESRDADLVLNTGTQLFGDITLVAKFVPMFGKLEITKLPEAAEGNFIFRIYGQPSDTTKSAVDMYVTAKAGENNAVLITELPVGTYTVTEQTAWSWRYQPTSTTTNPATVVIDDPATVEEVTFTNEQTNFLWLDDEDAVHNVLGTPAPVTTGTPADN